MRFKYTGKDLIGAIVVSAGQGSSAWRGIYAKPLNVNFSAGPFCPHDYTPLESEALTGLPGWVCPSCRAFWDRRGLNGVWLSEQSDQDGEAR